MPIYRSPTMKQEPGRFIPLSAAGLHILLALAGEELHGYRIMLAAARQADRQYKLGPGTLFDHLKKVIAAGIVEESRRPKDGDTPRKYYSLAGLRRSGPA